MTLSLNLTIYNKEALLPEVLCRIKEYTTGTYEIVFVLDGCTDGSEAIVMQFIKDNPQIETKVFMAPNVFETRANNIAARASTGEYVCIIQDDCMINEMAWNERMLKPFKAYDEVFAVTANCSHNWTINPNSVHIHDTEPRDTEWSDILLHCDYANRNTISRETFGVRCSANRGPLMINHADFEIIGFFDEVIVRQDFDDHMLMYDVKKRLNKIVGCYWIDYISDLNWGGTRVNGQPQAWLLKANQINVRTVYERHKDIINNHTIENRYLP